MKSSFVAKVLVAWAVIFSAVAAHAEDISGTISATKVITEDSALVGDVTCTVVGAPCIQFGASDISLKLNGFSVTGQADSVASCRGTSTAGEDGINITGRTDVTVLGVGLVQRFRGYGVSIVRGAARARVVSVTASSNCLSGIFLGAAATDNHVEGNVAVRNGNATAPCGGI